MIYNTKNVVVVDVKDSRHRELVLTVEDRQFE